MTRTLLQLRKSVEKLIQYHGENAPVAAWIFTKDDVVDYPDGVGEKSNISVEVANKVIRNLDDYDHIYSEIFDVIESELRGVGAM